MIDETRIIELESKLAYQEEAINKISDEYYQQQKQIEILQVQQKALMDKIRDLQNNDSQSPIMDEKPPHY